MMPIKSSPVDESSPPVEKVGIPRVARASTFDAPVHIDVGGTIYTSSLETLTSYPNSRLAKMFNGTIPIILDGLKQHYFIDRDGKMFRHILNYLRYKKLMLPDSFHQLELLIHEAHYFGLENMVLDLKMLQRRRERVAGVVKGGLEVPVQAPEINVPTQEDQPKPSRPINALNSRKAMKYVTLTRGEVQRDVKPSSQEQKLKTTTSVAGALDSGNAMEYLTTKGELPQEVKQLTQQDLSLLEPATPIHVGRYTFGSVDYYLSGHGIFNVYLKRIGKSLTDICWYCTGTDTAEHPLFVCPRFIEERQELERDLQTKITKENLVEVMLSSEEHWHRIQKFVTSIMKEKESHGRNQKALEREMAESTQRL